MQIDDPVFLKLASRAQKLQSRRKVYTLKGDDAKLAYELYKEKVQLISDRAALKKELKSSEVTLWIYLPIIKNFVNI